MVGEGGFLPQPSRAPAARGVGGGLCHRGGRSGSLTVPVNTGLEGASGFPEEERENDIQGRGQDIKGREEEELDG